MDLIYLIASGVVMGLIAAVPIGPVNLICIRRTFAFGPLNGFMSGWARRWATVCSLPSPASA